MRMTDVAIVTGAVQHLGVQDPSPGELARNGLLLYPDGLLLDKKALFPAEVPYTDSAIFVHKDSRAIVSSGYSSKMGSEVVSANSSGPSDDESPSFSGFYWRNTGRTVFANDPFPPSASDDVPPPPRVTTKTNRGGRKYKHQEASST